MQKLLFQLKVLTGVSWLLNAGLLLIVAVSITLFTVIFALEAETNRYFAGSYGLVPPHMFQFDQSVSLEQGREIIKNIEKKFPGVVALAARSFKMSSKVYWDKVVASRFSSDVRVDRRGSVQREISILALQVPHKEFTLELKSGDGQQSELVEMKAMRPDYFVASKDFAAESSEVELYDPATGVLLGQYNYEPDYKLFVLNQDFDVYEEDNEHESQHLEYMVQRILRLLPFDQSFRFQSGFYVSQRQSDKAKSSSNIATLNYLLEGATTPGSMVAYMTTALSDIIFFSKQRYHNIELVDKQLTLNMQIIASYISSIDETVNRNRIVCRLNDLPQKMKLVNGIACKNIKKTELSALQKYIRSQVDQDIHIISRDTQFTDLHKQRGNISKGILFCKILLFCVIIVIAISFFQKFCDVAIKELAVVKIWGGEVLTTVCIYGCCLFVCGTAAAFLANYTLLLFVNRALGNYYYSEIAFDYNSFVMVVGITFLVFLSGFFLVTFNMKRYLQ